MMSRQWLKKRSLVWLLVALTAAWGSVASAHLHLDSDHGHGEICHLPHSGATADTVIPYTFPPAASQPPASRSYHRDSAILLAYHSRAPPA